MVSLAQEYHQKMFCLDVFFDNILVHLNCEWSNLQYIEALFSKELGRKLNRFQISRISIVSLFEIKHFGALFFVQMK